MLELPDDFLVGVKIMGLSPVSFWAHVVVFVEKYCICMIRSEVFVFTQGFFFGFPFIPCYCSQVTMPSIPKGPTGKPARTALL